MPPSALQTFSAFAIPVTLILVSALIKKIVRGRSRFRLEDFCLGLELTLAAFSSAAVNLIEVNPGVRINLAWYLVIALIVLMLQIALHQQWTGTSVTWWESFWLLGLLSNGLGISVLAFFICWKIEGKL
jgi:hypothetical protein